MKSSARSPSFSRASTTARRAVGARKSMSTWRTDPVMGSAPGVDAGNETMTSPMKVVCSAASPEPQNEVCRPSVNIISILSAELLADSTSISTPLIGFLPGRNSVPLKTTRAALPSGKPAPMTSRRSPTSASRGAKSSTLSSWGGTSVETHPESSGQRQEPTKIDKTRSREAVRCTHGRPCL